MSSELNINPGVKMKANEIISALKANPSLIADALGVSSDKYSFTFDSSYTIGPKDIQYKKTNDLLNGTQHRIVQINGDSVKAAKYLSGIVAYSVYEGILNVVYTQKDKSFIIEPSTTTDASTGETVPVNLDSTSFEGTVQQNNVDSSSEGDKSEETNSADEYSDSSDDESSSSKSSKKSS